MTSVISLASYEYAAGAWVLRLTGQASSLGALAERAVLRHSRFHLWLGEDAAGDDRPQGNRSQAAGSGDSASPSPIFEVSGHGSDLETLTHLVQDYVQGYLEESGLTPSQGHQQGTMTLTPVGLTRHRLAVTGAAVVNLSLLQLADLAAVLAQADQSVAILPEALAPVRRRSRPRIPLWTGSVAAVLVAAVLGSQWLGQMPPAVVQSPTPTTEATPPQANGRVAPETDADAIVGETSRLAEEADSVESPAPDRLDRATDSSPESSPESSTAPRAGSPPAPTTAPRPGTNAEALRPPRQGAPAPPSPTRSPAPSVPAPSPPATDSEPLAPAPPQAADPAPAVPPEAPSPSRLLSPRAMPSPAEDRADEGSSESSPESSSELFSESSALESPPRAASPDALAPAMADDAATDWQGRLQAILQDAWTPIPGLASPLRYRLSLGTEGEVLALEPLTAAARQYLTQGTLPPVGSVLPHLRLPEPTTVEVDLLSSGEVRVSPSRVAPP